MDALEQGNIEPKVCIDIGKKGKGKIGGKGNLEASNKISQKLADTANILGPQLGKRPEKVTLEDYAEWLRSHSS